MSQNPQRKLLYIFDHADWKSRMPIARAAQNEGWDITIGIVGKPQEREMLAGFKTKILPQPEGKLTPFSAFKTILALRRLVRETRADLLHTVTIKYAFLLGLATSFQKDYSVIYTLAGLGFLFRNDGLKPKLIQLLLNPLLKMVFKDKKAQIIFQNPDDMDLMIRKNFIRSRNAHLVISSGVDLEKFSPAPPPESDEPLVLMPTRLVYEKGIHIFVEAARTLKAKGIKARFEIAGGETHHNPGAISKKEMEDMTTDGSVKWLGRVEDMPALLTRADIIVYPSYYGEGVPRVLLEAAATGRPIITTDHVGCREAVNDSISGILTPIKDTQATAAAIEALLNDKEKRLEMGRESHKKAEKEFDVKRIVSLTLDVYNTALAS